MQSQKVETQSISHCCLPSSQGNYGKGKKEQTRNGQRNTYLAPVSFVSCLLNIGSFSKPLNLLLQYPLTVCSSVSHTLLCPFFIHCQMSSAFQDVLLFWNWTSFHVVLLCLFRGLSTQKKICRRGHNILLHIRRRKTLKHGITVGLCVMRFLQQRDIFNPSW